MLDCCRQTQASERNAVTVLEAIPQRAATANPFTSGNPGSIGAAVVAAVVAMAVPEDPVVAVPTCADAIIPANAAKASIGHIGRILTTGLKGAKFFTRSPLTSNFRFSPFPPQNGGKAPVQPRWEPRASWHGGEAVRLLDVPRALRQEVCRCAARAVPHRREALRLH